MKKHGLLLLFALSLLKVPAQDPGFFNTNQSLLLLNPSFAGSNEGLRYQFSYTNPDAWRLAYLNSVDGYIRAIKAGVSVSYVQQRQVPELKTSIVNLTYAQHISLAKGKIKLIPSVQFTYGHEVPRAEYLGSGYTQIYPSTNYFGLSSGLLFNYKNNLYVGGYLFNINRPDIGVGYSYMPPVRGTVNISYNFHFREKTILQLSTKLDRQGTINIWQFTTNLVLFKHIIAGIGSKKEFEKYGSNLPSYNFFNLGYRHNFFTLSASYILYYDDYASSFLHLKFYSWELSASFNLRSKDKRRVLTSFEAW